MRFRPTVSPTRAWPYACGLAFALAVLLALAGASSGATSGTVVSATVPTSTSLDISGCSTPSALAFGSLATTTTTTTASPCHIQFGANAPARLTMYQRDRDGAAMTQVQPTLATRSGVPLYRAVDAVDANDIWVGGNRVNASDPTPLRHTVDGGTTWTDVTACASMSGAINHVAVWSATELLTINGTKVCRSTDTGASWTTITTPQSIGGRISTPAGTDVVWATTASAGRLLRSTDRGATWTSVLVPGAPVGFTNVVGWGTTNAVAVLTTTAADQLSKTATAYTTTDGGATWTSSVIATIPVTTIPAATGNMSLLDRSGSGRIVAMGSWALGNQFREYYSDDSGATWTALAVHPFTDTMRAIGGTTWVGGNRLSTATISTDDGLTWSNVAMAGGGSEYLRAITQSRSGSVVIVGDGSGVHRSITNGASWSSISPIYTSYLAVVAFDTQRLAVVATNGSVIWSNDAGATLQAGTGCGGSGFNDAVATGATSAVVVGSAGKVCRTTDAGQTWTSVPSGTGSTLTEVLRVERSGELIAHGGTAATFIHSTDDGLTWSTMTVGFGGSVSKFAVDEDASTLVASTGTAGQMQVSLDSGATWTARDDGITSVLQSLAVSPVGDRILAGHYPTVGDSLNKVASSVDGGATWTSTIVNAGAGDVYALRFTSNNRVWALAGNRVNLSDDAGATFTAGAVSAGTALRLVVLDANTVMTSGLGLLLAVSRPTVAVPDATPATGLTPAGGAFGACLLATTNAAPTWPSTGTCSAANPTGWRPAPPDAADPAATVASTPGGTASADLVFGLHVGATQASGDYLAHVVYEVVAP